MQPDTLELGQGVLQVLGVHCLVRNKLKERGLAELHYLRRPTALLSLRSL